MKSLKHELRSRLRKKRLQLPSGLRHFFANRIAMHLIKSIEFQKAKTIAFYSAMFGEVSTELIQRYALSHEKACYLPVLHNNILVFKKVTHSTQFEPNRFGILEPCSHKNQTIAPSALDLVLVPLVAFDPHCHRLGMGGGFYDRTFHFKRKRDIKPKLVGLAYDFQRVVRIPKSELDISLDSVITEKKRYHR